MELSLHFVTNLILFVVCASMGTMFLSITTPKVTGIRNYKLSLKALAGAYIVFALLTFAILAFKLPDNARELFTFIGVSISSFQAFLFTMALVALLNPKIVKLHYVFLQLIPYLLFTALYLWAIKKHSDPVIVHLNEIGMYLHNPALWVRLAFYGFYVVQLACYTWLFFREEKKYQQRAQNYFSDEVWLKLTWVRLAFIAALSVGIIAMFSYFFPQKYDWVFNIIYSIFYFGFAIEYVKYNRIYKFIEPVVIAETFVSESISPKSRTKYEWPELRDCIIANEYYLEAGINIEEIAKRLRIGRTTLSNLINREENQNFNTWINHLRIEKAKQILLERPDEPLSAISEKVGYTEQANFSRQFRQITGMAPTLWRQKQLVLTA